MTALQAVRCLLWAGLLSAGVARGVPAQEASGMTATAVPLTELQRLVGWRDLLAEGLAGWVGTHGEGEGRVIGPGWSYEGGVLHLVGGGQGGDLVSVARFSDFELEFEWCVSPGANSGVKFRVPYAAPGQARRGPEYQLLDDEAHPDGRRPETSAAALYDLVAPTDKPAAPPSRFRRGRILARGDHLEHWLDGRRVVEVSVDSPEFEAALAASKFADLPRFGRGEGHVVLQDHGDEVWFRRVFLRDLSSPPGREVELDTGPALRGWSRVGDARYTGDGRTITGEVTGGAQSFLYTRRLFGDFLLDVDVRLDVPANSGIQVRSTIDEEAGTLSGYQIEIDPTERRWSGGLYDERRRGWLDDLSDDPVAQAAFDLEGWNHYRIECVGPWLRAWVNGVPTADHLDGMTLEGVLALQVHSGPEGRFRWRDLRVRELGRHVWEALELRPRAADPLLAGPPTELPAGSSWTSPGHGRWVFPLDIEGPDASLRIRYAGDGRLVLLRRASDGVLGVTVATGAADDKADGVHVLEFHAHGERLSVVQDGRSREVVPGAGPAPGSAAFSLEASVPPGGGLQILGVERMVARPAAR